MSEIPEFKFAIREDLVGCGIDFLPQKSEPLSTGYDVRAALKRSVATEPLKEPKLVIAPKEYFRIPLGFRCFCPDGWYYQLHPRSSSFAKKHMHNLIGIIDESWEGETLFAGQFLPETYEHLTINFGDKIGQIIPVRRSDAIMTEISNEQLDQLYRTRNGLRKDGGFGSSGNK